MKALAGEGYTTPTPIQAQAIPPVMAGRDVCGIAQTGTGKTAAFALPILHALAKSETGRRPRAPRVLVLSPTRELASQIAASFNTYGAGLRIKTAVIFGGVSQRPQTEALNRGVDVLVATPGRLLDLVDQRALSLGSVEILVVDEADQMLDLGFIVPLRKIVKLVPASRQTLFFSATMPKTISHLADSILTDPVQVAVTPVATTAERVEQSVIFVSSTGKQPLLERILQDESMDRVLVFTRTKHGADKVVKNLARARIEAAAIHGNKSQSQRERALAAFRSGNIRVLVATDIAARGIHVESVSHVVNYELPNVAESYVHRIGRTARAGAAGQAISFCNGEERSYLRDIERLTRNRLPVTPLPDDLPAAAAAEPADEERRERPRGNRRPQQGKNASGGRPGRGAGQPGSGRGKGPGQGQGKGRGPGQGQKRRGESPRPGLDQATGLPHFMSRPQQRGAARP